MNDLRKGKTIFVSVTYTLQRAELAEHFYSVLAFDGAFASGCNCGQSACFCEHIFNPDKVCRASVES